MIDRRRLIVGSATLASALAAGAPMAAAQGTSQPQGTVAAPVAADASPFSPTQVTDLARMLARRPYVAPGNDLPDAFASLSYDQYVSIRANADARVWSGDNRGFVIEPLHRGSLFKDAVTIYLVEDGAVRRLAYDVAKFDFGRLSVQPPTTDIGFSGFRIFFGSGGERPYEVALFQGATFFRAIARGQNMGVAARTLTLRPGEAKGEEVPTFRAFWIERPSFGADALAMHALLDSESVTGAVQFTLRPGDMTILDVEVTLFPRVNVDHVGWGGMMSTYLFGAGRRSDDIRQAVYETNGLQMFNGKGEWIWRPLNNPQVLQISAFVDTNPRGFGLLQRDRDFSAFQDDEQHFERRPSLWVEPLADWGDGSVQLIEIPTESEVNDNVIAYWRPRQPLQAGTEVSHAYRQYWCWSLPEKPALAQVMQTRTGRGSAGRRRRFLVEFVGGDLGEPRTVVEVKPALSAATGTIHNVRVWPYPERKALRVGFELDPASEQGSELRLVLEAAGKALSETWLYRWTP